MKQLADDLRKRLGKVIRDARRKAEAGAKSALEALAVDRPEPHDSMTPEERALRNRLRAHGRQLGDRRQDNRAQEIRRLAHEVAYEHWHRMLFARFLAENHILIEPESGVAVSMDECEELAREAGTDVWALAARFAERMLPRIFRTGDPALELVLAPEARLELERLLASLPVDVFRSDDALGWTYQFWQEEEKDRVNESGRKIGADELPAVTQLFTEHYMVLFLFHNTIGAWRAGKVLAERPELRKEARSEDELRAAVRMQAGGGYDFEYLRFVRDSGGGDREAQTQGPWRPAAGTFEGWPRRASELRVLDPCCGSGHFLVEGLGILVRLRMEEEGLEVEDAIRAVLAENLFGLEIDPRCTQIAAFNVALAAWKMAGRPLELPPLGIACSGLSVGATREEWVALAGDDERLRNGMAGLYEMFEKAPVLGSLIDPGKVKGALFQSDYGELLGLLEKALGKSADGDEAAERAVAAQGMARSAELLAGKYTLVITNVPYLTRGKHDEDLRAFADRRLPAAKGDTATLILLRAFAWLESAGTVAIVSPQSWLFLPRNSSLRRQLLAERAWLLVARLGTGAFEAIGGHVVNVGLLMLSNGRPSPAHALVGIDASFGASPREKAVALRQAEPLCRIQADQSRNPDARITLAEPPGATTLAVFADCKLGVVSGDASRWIRKCWEVRVSNAWRPLQGPPTRTRPFDGRDQVVDWRQNGDGMLRPSVRNPAYGRWGVAIGQMGELTATIYGGDLCDNSAAAIVPNDLDDLPALWAFCSSPHLPVEVRIVDKTLKVLHGSFLKVPFDLTRWQSVAAEKYPNGLPEPQSDDPTQWLFHGHPASADPPTALQVGVARLLGYCWPPEHDPGMRLAPEARACVERCRDLHPYADTDGIVPLPAIRGEAGAAERLRRLLAAAFGPSWSPSKERELLAAASGSSTPAASLEEWLRDSFFEEHCALFHQRPFVWHIWDGRKDGFNALVGYHRLAGPHGEGRRTLEALTYSYLGDWIERCRAEVAAPTEGAEGRLAAALDLRTQLERILEGEPPCDIFVRWKPLHEQPVGWEPDINDGVRVNIRPFLRVALSQGGRKGAGILRAKPGSRLHWKKDKGKEPESLRPKDDYPWFWSCPGDGALDFAGGPTFDGNRWNALHYTRETKDAARSRRFVRVEAR